MVVNFSVQNFGSIKHRQTLSFEADKSTHMEEYYILKPLGELRLLKLGLIYGANASGKTTILNALEFLRTMVLAPLPKKNDGLNFNPFLFDTETPHENSKLAIDFIQNGARYAYEVEFKKSAVVREELNFYKPNKASVYKRTTDLDKQLTEIKFGSKIRIDKTFEKTLESNTLWNNTVLGGFLKTNIELPEIKEATDWFKDYLNATILPQTNLVSLITSRLHGNDIPKKAMLNILAKADLNISDILIREEEKLIPKDVFEELVVPYLSSNWGLGDLDKARKITAYDIEFEHTVEGKKYTLPFESESEGTKKYFGFAGLLNLLINKSVAFPVDELESSLHPDLYLHFLLMFLANAKQSQIIATTHNRELLNNKDLFRNDAIWFTDKSKTGATELYSLADFDTATIRDTTNVLNAYKTGKLGGMPNLGDMYIDVEHEA